MRAAFRDPRNPDDRPLVVGGRSFSSRLFVGTGKYSTFEVMQEALEVSRGLERVVDPTPQILRTAGRRLRIGADLEELRETARLVQRVQVGMVGIGLPIPRVQQIEGIEDSRDLRHGAPQPLR